MHPKMSRCYIGVDTHKNTHAAVIINFLCEKLGEITFENKPGAFGKFMNEIEKYCTEGTVPVYGLEDTAGTGRALTVYLLKHNRTVKKVDSTLSYSERRNQSIIHKTDGHDAECVARVLLNKFDTLPNASFQDLYWTIRMLVSRRDALVKASTALKNQVHTYIMHHYPSYRQFFSVFDCKTALEFWRIYPSPSKLNGVTPEELAEFLSIPSKGIFSLKKAKQILELVEADGDTTTELQETRDFIITLSIQEHKHNCEEMAKIETELRRLMDITGYKLESMIGLDLVSAAAIVAEIGDISRFESADKLSRYAGISPVTYSSGSKNRTFKNRQGNRQLYWQIRLLAFRNVNKGRNKDKPVNDIFYEYYEKKKAEGKTRQQAIVCVMRRMIGIIYGLMKNKTEYIHPPTVSKG
jgi:transposase